MLRLVGLRRVKQIREISFRPPPPQLKLGKLLYVICDVKIPEEFPREVTSPSLIRLPFPIPKPYETGLVYLPYVSEDVFNIFVGRLKSETGASIDYGEQWRITLREMPTFIPWPWQRQVTIYSNVIVVGEVVRRGGAKELKILTLKPRTMYYVFKERPTEPIFVDVGYDHLSPNPTFANLSEKLEPVFDKINLTKLRGKEFRVVFVYDYVFPIHLIEDFTLYKLVFILHPHAVRVGFGADILYYVVDPKQYVDWVEVTRYVEIKPPAVPTPIVPSKPKIVDLKLKAIVNGEEKFEVETEHCKHVKFRLTIVYDSYVAESFTERLDLLINRAKAETLEVEVKAGRKTVTYEFDRHFTCLERTCRYEVAVRGDNTYSNTVTVSVKAPPIVVEKVEVSVEPKEIKLDESITYKVKVVLSRRAEERVEFPIRVELVRKPYGEEGVEEVKFLVYEGTLSVEAGRREVEFSGELRITQDYLPLEPVDKVEFKLVVTVGGVSGEAKFVVKVPEEKRRELEERKREVEERERHRFLEEARNYIMLAFFTLSTISTALAVWSAIKAGLRRGRRS